MKRLIMLAVLCAFVLGATAASAADLKVSGGFLTDAMWQGNQDFDEDADGTAFDLKTRMDLVFQVVASEDLKAVLYTRTEGNWGRGNLAVGTTDKDSIGLRRMYIDFNTMGQRVQAGYLAVSFANAFGGSQIMAEEVAGLVVSGAITENVSYAAAYVRPSMDNTNSEDMYDVYYGALPMTFGETSVTPFVAIANVGKGDLRFNDEVSSLWWAGATLEMDIFDPLTIAADLNYGALDVKGGETNDAEGWHFGVDAQYALDFATAEAYFVYTSGEDDKTSNGSERMPQIVEDWAVGTFFFGGDYFMQGSIGGEELGYWILGAQLNDIASFAEGLTHQAIILYAQGTNDKDSAGNLTYTKALTEEDYMLEIDFNTYYQLMDQLTVGLELGYIDLSLDDDTWAQGEADSAFKVSTGLAYSF